MQSSRAPQVQSISVHKTDRVWTSIFPIVFRYLPEQYVDEFFADGSLRLSTIRAFAQHADEARGDTKEGRAHVLSEGAGRTFGAHVAHSENAYILCGSRILSSEIRDQFSGSEAVIEIHNVSEFGFAVARQLAGFQWGIDGPCIYSPTLVRGLGHDPFPLPPDGRNIPVERLLEAAQVAGQDEEFFLKAPKFAPQLEHRLIWNVDTAPGSFVHLKAPEARQFCRKLKV